MPIGSLRILCLVTAVFCNVQWSLERGIPRRSFLSRRAIDGTRGRKYFDPNEEGSFDSYGSAGGQYDPYDHVTDLSDIRKNVPGEPGVDYPAYTILPQTGFTCEGRSRGYYADEAAGCQVFHVCHDVLVSSFLCPIGSTFSQKLLTCDWWTKVDCSSTNRYFAVNRNNYQIDDDEMIRNAYAMISLQSAEDVTKDGLVDPDGGARIIDYAGLVDRTMGYTSGFRRITDYPSVDATGNDLPNGFEDYSHQNYRQIVNYDRYQQKSAKTSPVYQNKYHQDKERSPYHAALIIRHDYQDRSGDNEFQDDYRNRGGFTNRLQTSYAPTVPTVTTTTRRLYSPTVPTTYRPSTLAYSKLDLLVDSSDHLYAHSKSLVTPPTIIRQNDDSRDMNSNGSEMRHDDLKKSESTSSSKMDGDDQKDDVRSKDDQVRLNFEEKSSGVNFRINVTDMIDEDEVFRQQNDRPVIQNNSEESVEDIETKDSIGIARALNNLPRRIIMQNQNPVNQMSKNEQRSLTISPKLHVSRSSEFYEESDIVNSTQILRKSDVVAVNETNNDRTIENYEDIANSTTRNVEEKIYTRISNDETTSLLINKNRQPNGDNTVQPSTISKTLNRVTNTTEKSIDEAHDEFIDRFSFNNDRTIMDQNSSSSKSVSSFNGSVREHGFKILQPAQFLEPPPEGFFINVPEETRYTTFDDNSKISWSPEIPTTEISQFSSTFPGNNQGESSVYNENIDEQPLIDYDLSETSALEDPVDRAIDEISTPVPWLLSTWHDREIVNVPATDIVPPIVDYNDGFGDFVPPDRDEHENSGAAKFDHTKRVESQKTQDSPTTPKNDSEMEILSRYNTEFQFTIRDAIKTPIESKVHFELPCNSTTADKQTRLCEASSAVPKTTVSTLSAQEKIISIDNKTTTRIPEQLISSDNTKSSEKIMTLLFNESSISTTPSPITVSSNINTEQLVLKTVTSRGVPQIKGESPEEKTEKTVNITTVSSMLFSNRPESLKQVEETIDRYSSPYQVSLTLKKDEDLDTTADDFISRLITHHQQSTPDLEEQLDDFEIIRSIQPEDEITPISQTPIFSDISYTPSRRFNNSVFIVNDTIDQPKELNSNVSMLSLLQLMAELLKLDRLPRPFSTKELHNVELDTSLDLEESSFVTANPLLDYSQTGKPFRNTDFTPSVFDILKTSTDIAEPETLLNLNQNEASFVTTSSVLDHSQSRTPYRNANSRAPSFHDISETHSNFAFKSSPDISFRANSDHSTELKLSQPETENRTTQPLQKHEILEQLMENFGQPLYRDDSIHRSLIFDLPEVQRSLNFETGLPIEENKHVIDEAKKDSVSSTTGITTTTQKTTTTTEKTIVETEFVPSIGFSFDTNEGRQEYVEAVLGGLINDHTHDGDKNESGITQITDGSSKNKTSKFKQEGSKDVSIH